MHVRACRELWVGGFHALVGALREARAAHAFMQTARGRAAASATATTATMTL